jgi:hypothetical protein
VQAIIDKYGLPAWLAAERQIWVNFSTDLIWLVVLYGLALTLWRSRKRALAWVETLDSFDEDMGWGATWVGTRLLPVVLVLVSGFSLYDALTIIINPTWAAINILASLLPGK